MAKVLGPLHSDRVKGSISGMAFREYRGMATVNRRAKPVERWQYPLSNVRSIFSYLSKHWGVLNIATRQAWTDYAAAHPRSNGMGGTFQLDGNQMYMSLNHTCIRLFGFVGLTIMPPTQEPTAVVDTLAATEGIAIGGITLHWTLLGDGDSDAKTEIRIAGPFNSPGRVQVGSRFKTFGMVAGNILTFEVTGLQPGAWYWCGVRYCEEDGQQSNMIADQCLAKA